MKEIKYLKVEFDLKLEREDLRAFRAALSHLVGFEHRLFHNHISEDAYVHRYPLIQYKKHGSRPLILCLEEGVKAMQHLFDIPHWNIDLKGNPKELRIQRVEMSEFNLRLDPTPCTYQIQDWIALSQKNFADYQQLKGIIARAQFLENILKGNILSFAKDLGWWIDQPVEVCLLDWNEPRTVYYKGNKLLSFDFQFESNVALPNHIGLGKKVSLGYGVVKGEESNTSIKPYTPKKQKTNA